jgi:Domain of unknown function (DUF4124)
MNIPRIFATIVLLGGLCQSAGADVWRWIDANGDTHFVDTIRPIYTWRDESGKVFFSDKPDHVNAVSVELIWHSAGRLEDVEQDENSNSGSNELYPGETEAERAERMQAEAYYCKRATEIYDSYVNAPRLYKTGADGEPEYLSDEEATQTIAETKAKVDDLCS